MKSKNGFEVGQRYDFEMDEGSTVSGTIESFEDDFLFVDDLSSGKKKTIDTKKLRSVTQVNMSSKGFSGGTTTGTGSFNVGASGPGWVGGESAQTAANYHHPSGFGGSGSERKYHRSGCGCGKCGAGNCWIPY